MAKRSKSQRNYDTYRALHGRTIDILRSHIAFRSTHARILEDLTERIFNTPEYKRIPVCYRDMLSVLRECWFDRINELHLEYRMGPETGPVRTAIVDEWTPEIQALASTPGALYAAHYWKHSDRLYGEWKASN